MAGILGGGGTTSNPTPVYTGINIQTSTQGMAIPIGWGTFRAGANILWYGNFQATPDNSGAGKGGGGNKQYDYSASFIMGICEGDYGGIQGIGTVWAGNSTSSLYDLNMTLFVGSLGQTPWSYLTEFFPGAALSYSGTAYVATENYALGSSPDLPSHNFEIIGKYAGSISGFQDANFGDIVYDFLTNAYYGLGFPTGDIDSIENYTNYCGAFALFGSPYLNDEEQASDTLGRWATITNSWFFWSGNLLKFLPLGTESQTANGYTFVANTSPIYDLVYDDFVFDNEGGSKGATVTGPVEVTRIDPIDGYNSVELDIKDRSNNYNDTKLTWYDQASVDLYGQLQSNVINATEINDVNIGTYMAALIGKRSVYIRNTFKFTLTANWVLIEVGDIVTITDPNIGISKFPVRITSIEEQEDQTLEMEAEEFPPGIGSTTSYPGTPAQAGPTFDPNVAPGNVNTPAIFEPNAALTGGTPQVWIAASGGADWGGCVVYVSFDGGTSFSQIGEITAGAAQGVLTTALAVPTAQPDTTNTLAVTLAESNSSLPATASDADAAALRTLCLVDSELLAYGSVAVGTGVDVYDLTYLYRGVYGTTAASHSTGATFTRIDPNQILTYDLPIAYIGTSLVLKFQSYNIFGQGYQALADSPTYDYTPSGAGYAIGPPTAVGLSASRTTQADGTTILSMNCTWTASVGPILGSYQLQISTNSGSSWSAGINIPGTATSYSLSPAVASTNYQFRVRAVSTTGINISSWANSATVNSGSLVASVPAAPTGVTTTASGAQVTVGWTNPTDPTILYYRVYRAAGTGSFGSASLVQAGSFFSWTDLSVSGNTEYTYYVTAVNAQGESSPSAGSTVTTGPVGSGNPYDVPMSYIGAPPAASGGTNFRFYRAVLARTVVFSANFAGSQMVCRVAPTASYTVTVYKNGSSVGTGTISASATTGTFSSSGVTFSAGDVLEIDGQAVADATLADLSVTLTGVR